MVWVGLRLYGIERGTTVVRKVRVNQGGADDCPIWGRASRAKVTHDGVWWSLVGREGRARLDKRGGRHGVMALSEMGTIIHYAGVDRLKRFQSDGRSCLSSNNTLIRLYSCYNSVVVATWSM
jgi:hypothetical protein